MRRRLMTLSMLVPLFVCAGLGQDADAEARVLEVPWGSGIVLDGELGAEEWREARVLTMGGGGALLVRHDADHLYVGVRGKEPGLVHVYLLDENAVVVLHASAALGLARYERDDLDRWQPTTPFPQPEGWVLRDAAATPEARAARQAFLEREGWVATNSGMNATCFELVVARKRLGGGRLAVAFRPETSAPRVFPLELTDACTDRTLLTGSTPGDLEFHPERWMRLRLAPAPDTGSGSGSGEATGG